MVDISSAEIAVPIVLNYDGDLMVARTIKGAESYAEAYDVEHGNVEFFDANGKKLTARVEKKIIGTPAVRLSASNAEPTPERVRKLLIKYLHGRTGIESMSLSDLLSAMEATGDDVD